MAKTNSTQVKSIRLVSIRTNPKTNEPEAWITCIGMDSSQAYFRCTKQVYSEVKSDNYTRIFDRDFFLEQDDDKVVTRIHTEPKQVYGQVFTESQDTSGGTGINVVIIEKKWNDGGYHIRVKPAGTPREDVNDMIQKLEAHEGEVKQHDILGDKWLVADVRDGGKRIHISTTSV